MSFPGRFRPESFQERAKYTELSLELGLDLERMVCNSMCVARIYLIFQMQYLTPELQVL